MATTDVKKRYSDNELQEFKKIIDEKIKKAKAQIKAYSSMDVNENSGEPAGMNERNFYDHASSNGNVNSKLIIQQELFVRKLTQALDRIQDKTYGVCRATGRLINPERLKVVPHTTFCVEAKNNMS